MKNNIRKLALTIAGIFMFIIVTADRDNDPCDCNYSVYGKMSYLKNEGCALPHWGWTGFTYKNGIRDCCRKAVSANPPGCYKSQEHQCKIPTV